MKVVLASLFLILHGSLVSAKAITESEQLNEIPEVSLNARKVDDLSRQNNLISQAIVTAENIRNLLQSSPILQAMLSNSTVQTVLSDPIVQNVLQNPTVQSVLGNSVMQNILLDPELQGLAMQTLLTSFTTPSPPTTQPPVITSSISSVFETTNAQPPRVTAVRPISAAIQNIRPLQRPVTQQAIMTAIVASIDELLNILQRGTAAARRNRNNNRNNGQRS